MLWKQFKIRTSTDICAEQKECIIQNCSEHAELNCRDSAADSLHQIKDQKWKLKDHENIEFAS